MPETTQQGRSQRVHRGTKRPVGKSEQTRKNTPFPSPFKTMASTCHAEGFPCNANVTYNVPSATTPKATRSCTGYFVYLFQKRSGNDGSTSSFSFQSTHQIDGLRFLA